MSTMRLRRITALGAILGVTLTGSRTVAAQSSAVATQTITTPAQPAPTPAQVQAASLVQAGVVVRPDTVTIGDPFSIVARVRVPLDARVQWPDISDTAATIAPRAPMIRRDDAASGSTREEVAEYPVAAWDTGQLATDWPPVLVIANSDTVRVRLADARVYVQSVLSADTAEHVPRPPKPPFALAVPWWQRWWLALLAVAAVAGLLWWRARRRSPDAARVLEPVLGPYDRALRAFERLERLALTDAGEHGRAVTLAMDILRTYLLARLPRTSLAHTSAELLAGVADDPRVPVSQLVALLVQVDAIKYARQPLDAREARTLLADAKGIVQEIEERDRERRERDARAIADAAAGRDGTDAEDDASAAREPAGVS